MCDVLVAGGGNAALCAAIAARQAGATVILAERAPRAMRGGNTRHSRNFRIMHDAPTPLMPGAYTRDDYWTELKRVTGGRTDEDLAHLLIGRSAGMVDWLAGQGVRFQDPADGDLPPSRRTAFFLGGGKALVNTLYARAEGLGVDILYDAEVRVGRETPPDGETGAVIIRHGREEPVAARTLVAACGGFQANIESLRRHWGEAADGFIIRGTPYCTGEVLDALLARGAGSAGDPTYCHIVAVDARSPRFDGGIVTRVLGIAGGIVVDRTGRRFADEGRDITQSRYSTWGDLVAGCPGQIAWLITDTPAQERLAPAVFAPIEAGTVAGLARTLGFDEAALTATVDGFNRATGPSDRASDPDGGHTEGLIPAKTRHARPIVTPPFTAVPIRPGITATGLGVRVDARARVLAADGRPLDGVFAAGPIMAANILGRGYLAGMALTIGAVFGRIAGQEAAAHAQRR
jgi:tricarballylate dehydrogenase